MPDAPAAPQVWPLGDAIYRQLLGSFVDAMYLHDDSGVIWDVNQAACDSLGYSRNALVGRYVYEISGTHTQAQLLEMWRLQEAGDNVVAYDQHRRKDGSLYHVEVHISCQEHESHKYFLVLARDIDEKYHRDAEVLRLNQQLEEVVHERTRKWQESLRLLEIFMEQTPDAVFIKDGEGRYQYANPALLRRTRRPLNDIVGRTDAELFPMEMALSYAKSDAEALARNEPILFEERLTLRGRTMIYNVLKAPYRNENDQVVGILGMMRDITDTRQAQDQIAHNYEMLRQAERIAKVGSWTLNLQTQEFTASEELMAMNGLTPDDPPLTPDSLGSVMSPQDHAALSAAIGRCIQDGTAYMLDVQHKHPQGGTFPCRIRGQAYRDPQGRIVMLHGTLQDMSEHVEARDRLQSLADNLPNGAIFRCHQPHGQRIELQYVSGGIQSLLGYSANHLMQDPLLFPRCVYPEDYPYYQSTVLESARTHSLFDVTMRMLRSDGQLRWIHARATPRRLHNEVVWEGILLDVTAEHEAQQALQRAKETAEAAEKAKSEFLATMSHEIRTPMNTVIGMTQLLQQSTMTPKQRNYVDKVARAASALLAIINDILDYSKLEAQMLVLDEAPFTLDELLETVASVTSLRAEQKGIEMIYAVHPQVPRQLVGDMQRLSQVLTNLISNAIKFTDRGEVAVHITPAASPSSTATPGTLQQVLQISVRDTGIGITPEQIQKLFQPFSQAEAHISRRFGGTGLGLAISRRLVEMMGGHIAVDSVPGQGSDFHFTVQLQVPAAALLAPRLEAGQCKVLLVDDNPLARDILSDMVRSMGLECQCADSGSQALELLHQACDAQAPYTLVLTDWRMPGMDGLQLAERIRLHEQLSTTPAMLMVTAYGREEVLSRVQSLGLQGVLIKPVTESALFNAMQEALVAHHEVPAHTPIASPVPMQQLRIPPELQGRRVLVVDDNGLNREVAHDMLQLAQVSVTTASSGRQALELLQQYPFDAVLLDVQMPEMDGMEVARRIRSQPQWRQLPVLALTAQARSEDREAILACGMDGHLSKPIEAQILYDTLQQHLRDRPFAGPPVQSEAPPPHTQLPAAGLEHHLSGQHDRVQRLLRAFVRDFEQSPQDMRRWQAAQDWEQLGRLAHTLKGSLGYLQQPVAVHTMEQLEQQCLHAPPANAELTQRAALLLEQVLAQVQAELLVSVPPAPPSPTRKAAALPAHLLGLARAAQPHIRRGDYAGVQLLEQLEAALRGHVLHGMAASVLSLTEDLENDKACVTLQALCDALAAIPPRQDATDTMSYDI